MLTLRAPYIKNGLWCLEGTADLSTGDRFTVRAELSPRTLQWAKRSGSKLLERAGRGVGGLGKRAASMVRYEGDWASLGPAASAAAEQIAGALGYPSLSPPKKLLGVKEWYQRLRGDKGGGEQAEAQRVLAAAEAVAAEGDESAAESLRMAAALGAADAMLSAPDAYDQIGACSKGAELGDPAAAGVLQAAKALGACCCNATDIVVSGDAEELLVTPDKYLDFCRTARDVMLLRSLGSAKKQLHSPFEVQETLRALVERADCGQYRRPQNQRFADGSFAPYGASSGGAFAPFQGANGYQ